MSATPYELRAQFLRQAEGILMIRYQIEHDKLLLFRITVSHLDYYILFINLFHSMLYDNINNNKGNVNK